MSLSSSSAKIRTTFFRVLGASLVFLALGSCTSLTEGSVTAQGGLDISIDLGLFQQFGDYLVDLQDTMGGGQGQIFDRVKIKEEIGSISGMALQDIQVPSRNPVVNPKGARSVALRLTAPSIAKLGVSGPFAGLVDLKSSGTESILTFKAGPRLVKAMIQYISSEEGENLDYVLPDAKATSPAKYQEQLAWALGDYGSPAELKAMFAASRIKVLLNLPRPVKSVKALSKEGDRAVRFEIGVLEAMTLQEERICEVRY